DEPAYRVLMRLHDASGNRARALRVYHACAAALEAELGVEPSEPTRRAYQALLPAERTGPARGKAPARAPLVGRSTEWARLIEYAPGEQRGARLVLITGEPGIGKTRLVEDFRGWWVQRGGAVAAARSYPAEGPIAFGPVVSWLRSPALAP